jgi:hypothetical protein
MSLVEAQDVSAAPAPAPGPLLNLFSVFHLNLAFSAVEEEDRASVIQRCYWPLLALAASHGPIGIEATGFTLEEIEARDPNWIARLKDLIQTGKVELVGSGYAQIIGPLVPSAMVAANLRLGNEVYQRLLGTKPTLAMVNEQAYSGGLVGHYLDAGFAALLMDWDNPASHHADWHAELRYAPQRAQGADGRAIALLWTNTVAFQKLQRYAHGDISLDDYLGYVAARRNGNSRALCVYASDGEIFDFRPGRYRTEEVLTGGEWERLGAAFAALHGLEGGQMVRPSQALALESPHRGRTLRLESAACPVPVKKQRKYNLTRWAVTGRDDIAINAACQRIYSTLRYRGAPDSEWKELCRLWASDFRTHITDARWKKYRDALSGAELKVGVAVAPLPAPASGPGVKDRFIDIETPTLRARLDRRRGLAIQSMAFAPDFTPCIGGLAHGHFDDIALQADWYTGDCVLEAPGESKVTDLEWAVTKCARSDEGETRVSGIVDTPRGPIEKHLHFHADAPRVDFDITFRWSDWGRGSLRVGHVTLLPDAFDWDALRLVTHNGGFVPDVFRLTGETVEHGAPVSFLVSASCGLGMTEGWAELGDGKRTIRVEVDRETAPLLGLLTHRRIGGSLFCQLALSALELDDTRKPDAYRDGPRRLRFSVLKGPNF